MRVHPGARRVRMDLHEQLPNHFAPQPRAGLRELSRRFARASLTGKSYLTT